MKTLATNASVPDYLRRLEHRGRAEDAAAVADMMERITGCPPRLWGDSIIGFGSYSYRRRDGSQHSYFLTGLAPRKANLVVYVMDGFSAYRDLLDRLGPHKHAKSCLYLSRLVRVDASVLERLVSLSVAEMKRRYDPAP